MGSCTRRHFILSTCFLQMMTIIERQLFDFLGYMWAPIILNFFQILFVIFGFYGAYHLKVKYIVTYLLWSLLWIGWNTFLICFYLNIGILDRDSDILNLGTGSVSWFEVNGYGCNPTYPTNITTEDPYRPIRPERVDDCFLDYAIVEIIQSGIQCALAIFGIIGSIVISYIFIDQDDRFDFMNGDAKSPQHTVVHPMYVSYSSIPTTASATMLSIKHQPNQSISSHLQQNNSFFNSSFHNLHTDQQFQDQAQRRSYNESNINNNVINNSDRKSNTFLIHTYGSSYRNSNYHSYKSNIHYSPNASKNSTLTNMIHENNNGSKSGNSIVPFASQKNQNVQCNYGDRTAKADQLYTNSNRRNLVEHHVPSTPNIPYDPSISYTSLHNSKSNLGADGITVCNSNLSIFNSFNKNNKNGSFPTQQYYSFKRSMNAVEVIKNNTRSSGTNLYRPEIKYRQVSNENEKYFNERPEDDNLSIQNFKNDEGMFYVPYGTLTAACQLTNINTNSTASYASLISPVQQHLSNYGRDANNNNSFIMNYSFQPITNNKFLDFFLENEDVAYPVSGTKSTLLPYDACPLAHNYNNNNNNVNNNICKDNSNISVVNTQTPAPIRPTSFSLPSITAAPTFNTPLPPLEVKPPAPCPHIFQPRCGYAPYPDLSSGITEKYSMPTQLLPRSPVISRILRRQRQQQKRMLVNQNLSSNVCDQIRGSPACYVDNGISIVRSKSYDRLTPPNSFAEASRKSLCPISNVDAAPHVNRRSGRREAQLRPRSYCNSLTGGEGVIRGHVTTDREMIEKNN